MLNSPRLALIAFALSLSGCSLFSTHGTFTGTYVSSFEVSSFTPVGSEWQGERWWLSGNFDEVVSPYLKNKDAPYAVPPHVLEVVGTLSGKGKYGHMGEYQRELKVERVILYKPLQLK